MSESQAPDVIRAEHIVKSFGAVKALRDISIHLMKGEVLGLVGDNGAGKSTLIKILTGFVQPDDGPKPRYLTMELLPLSFFAAAGWPTATAFVREQVGARMTRVVGVVMWIAPIFLITTYLENRVPQVAVQAGLEEALSKAQVASGVVIETNSTLMNWC